MRRLAKLFAVRPGETISEARCVPGRFGRAGLAISALVGPATERPTSEPPRHRKLVIVGRDGGVIARHRRAEYVDITDVEETHRVLATGDLDGDGVDELAVEKELATPMGSESELLVLRVHQGKLRVVLTRPFASVASPDFVPRGEHDVPAFSPETTLACEASVAFAPVGGARPVLVVTRTARRGANVDAKHLAGFCTGARERWRLAGGKAVPLED
jgi:hypothetical protein